TPSAPGTYWLIAQADASDNVRELSEANNFYVNATPLTIQPAYTATLAVDVHSALANTPIPMHGLATLGGTASPAAFVPITIHLDNLSDVPLTALSVTVVTNQPNLAVTASLETNALVGFGSANLRFIITALDPSIFQSPVVLRVSSAEGATATLTITVRVEA